MRRIKFEVLWNMWYVIVGAWEQEFGLCHKTKFSVISGVIFGYETPVRDTFLNLKSRFLNLSKQFANFLWIKNIPHKHLDSFELHQVQ